MEAPRQAMHPKRKRKFFADLARLLDEKPPAIRPLHSAFFGPELPAEYQVIHGTSSTSEATPMLSVPPHSLNSDSFESVEFGASRAKFSAISSCGASEQSWHHETVADSSLFLPCNSGAESSKKMKENQHVYPNSELNATCRGGLRKGGKPEEVLPVTILINSGIVSDKPSAGACLELVDYYETDRMCEPTPCWLQGGITSCKIHTGEIRRPMLLFCLQALDEFVARYTWQGQQRWRVQACKLARRVLATMWEEDLLDIALPVKDIVIEDCIAKKTTVPGVAYDVWCIIDRYWDKYKHGYLHKPELNLSDSNVGEAVHTASTWDLVRAALHIFGMKPSQALRLVDQCESDHIDLFSITDGQLQAVAHGLPCIEHLRFGIEYLQYKVTTPSLNSAPTIRRPMIDQQDAKTAFRAILIHLKKWNDNVQVFPCGSFSRGAAFVSVLDVLVAIPTPSSALADPHTHDGEKMFANVVAALTAAHVIQSGTMHQLTSTRGACIISFKSHSVLLDLKVYSPPKSWFALLYFTGSEEFVIAFFSGLLKRSLRDIPDTSFESIFSSVVDTIDHNLIRAVVSEKDFFDLADRDYLQPADRICDEDVRSIRR
uniref:DNA polymerase n=1 Tax=Hyaloperonospora arabidopsidis (strain Emoy2) TaxID=559515 RepID=M4C590_HYAAE